MEDAGCVKAATKADVVKSIASSILACEQVENDRRSRHTLPIRYERIYVLATFSGPLSQVADRDRSWLPGLKFYPAWSQVQLLYAEPALSFLGGRPLDAFRGVTFEEWSSLGPRAPLTSA